MSNLLEQFPKMKMGTELIEQLTVLPDYDSQICNEDMTVRLMKLSDLYSIYIPSKMSIEIYSKIYLSVLHALHKKNSEITLMQQYENHRVLTKQSPQTNGIIGGADSFSIIGCSGIGKSSAIFSAIPLITEYKIIEQINPYKKIAPIIIVQCPFDCSAKNLLYSILLQIDEHIGTNYFEKASRVKCTTDMLITHVMQASLNHCCLIIIDEIQNVVRNKNGQNLIAMLTQLINCSGISICLVGTPESADFFSQEMQLARRTLGLKYSALPYDDFFRNFCSVVFQYQYVKNKTEIKENIIEWLYEHSGGIISVVINLIHDAQEIAIMSNREVLDLETLNLAYTERIKMLHNFIQPSIITHSSTKRKAKKNKKFIPEQLKPVNDTIDIYELAMIAKEKKYDAVEFLSNYISIVELSKVM